MERSDIPLRGLLSVLWRESTGPGSGEAGHRGSCEETTRKARFPDRLFTGTSARNFLSSAPRHFPPAVGPGQLAGATLGSHKRFNNLLVKPEGLLIVYPAKPVTKNEELRTRNSASGGPAGQHWDPISGSITLQQSPATPDKPIVPSGKAGAVPSVLSEQSVVYLHSFSRP